jgi:hypothetical protein
MVRDKCEPDGMEHVICDKHEPPETRMALEELSR